MNTDRLRIKDLSNRYQIEDLAVDSYIPVDGPAGTKKLSMVDLTETLTNPTAISDLEILALD